MSGAPAVVILTAAAEPLARRIVALLPEAELHGLAGRAQRCDVTFTDTAEHLRHLFRAGRPVIGLCAAGVLIRSLAPLLADKREEPPVLAVAEDGSAVVPLLGGHRGANDLARRIAAATGAVAALTTAGDLRFGVALDEPPAGWRLANPQDVKPFVAGLLAGAGVRVEGPAPWLADARLPLDAAAKLEILVTERVADGCPDRLVYHPAVLVVGIGCERGAPAEDVVALARRSLAEAGLAEASVAAVCSLDLKADEPAVQALAEHFGVAARFFDAPGLEALRPQVANPSEVVFRAVGTHSVAEAAALAGAGPGGRLLVPKRTSSRATCAVALAAEPAAAMGRGRARGRLFVVGTGPGSEDWLTPEAAELLRLADDIVGYGLYLDLLGRRIVGKPQHRFPLGEEVARVRHALTLAAQGRSVALVSSGDPGIYAMASLVFEVLERSGEPAWSRLDIRIAPGISALQAAAARAGAPLGHDFCAISLSDLLTPWPVIETRIRAAAEADFVIAFYNPVSRRRTTQLAAARAILLRHRPSDTPVVLARNLGREAEAVTTTTLDRLTPESVDMLTLVLVGNSATRAVRRGDGSAWIYTPRGYRTGSEGREAG